MMLMRDIQTILWKEWKEMFAWRAAGRGTLLSTLVILLLLGAFLPLQSGEAWFTQPLTLACWAWVPVFLTLGIVTDSFAGERERHTLETLLATRLPDTAILLGKILASVLYGWGVAVLGLCLSALTLNIWLKGGPYFYAPAFFAAALGLSLLAACGYSTPGLSTPEHYYARFLFSPLLGTVPPGALASAHYRGTCGIGPGGPDGFCNGDFADRGCSCNLPVFQALPACTPVDGLGPVRKT
jgi:ABC-type transport system involved in cytochrome c biogenesis permease component